MSKECSNTYFSKKVTFFNVTLTLLIVLLHAKTPERWGLELTMEYPLIYMLSVLCQISVPLFFFISGILFYRDCTFTSLTRKLKSRVSSLLVPYVLWNIIYVGIYFILTHLSFTHDLMNMGEALNSPHEVLIAIINSRFSVLWFVKDLLIFTILSPIILLILKNAWICLLCLCLISVLSLTLDTEYESLLRWFPVYLQGAIIGHLGFSSSGEYISFDRITRIARNKKLCAIFISLIFIGLYFATVANESFVSVFRLFSPMILWVLSDIALQEYIKNKFIVKKWMSYTFFIFCTHKFILDVIQKLCALLLPPTYIVLNIVYFITPILTICMIITIANYLHNSQLYKILCGGR